MVRIFANSHYDFIGVRRRAILITGALLVLGIIALIARGGLSYSVEFTGGTMVDMTVTKNVDIEALRSALTANGLSDPEITPSGANEYIVRATKQAAAGSATAAGADSISVTAAAITKAFEQVVGPNNYKMQRKDAVGPKVGKDLRTKAFLAIFLSFFAVLAYLAFRFEWRFGLAAVIATAHDIVLTICFIAVIRLEVSLVVVAAVLSMVGYSLNDTIVIFDRVRENLRKNRRDQLESVLNRSINETLPRSVLTHTTALATLTALAVFGGPVIRPFSLVMFFGVFTGTFSSVFIAAPALLIIEKRWPGVDGRGVKVGSAKGTAASRSRPRTA